MTDSKPDLSAEAVRDVLEELSALLVQLHENGFATPTPAKAAALLEAQQAEIERLTEALRGAEYQAKVKY